MSHYELLKASDSTRDIGKSNGLRLSFFGESRTRSRCPSVGRAKRAKGGRERRVREAEEVKEAEKPLLASHGGWGGRGEGRGGTLEEEEEEEEGPFVPFPSSSSCFSLSFSAPFYDSTQGREKKERNVALSTSRLLFDVEISKNFVLLFFFFP